MELDFQAQWLQCWVKKMSDREDSWSGAWCKEKLKSHDKIKSIEVLASNLISVTHIEFGSVIIATMSLAKISKTKLQEVIGEQKIDFVLNVSKEPYITAKALKYAHDSGFSIGGLGDAMRALRDGNLHNYISPEIKFILRGLRQHSKVNNIARLDNRRFQIERHGLPTVTILTLNEYELTADAVRNAIDQFPQFTAILKSNPNGRILDSSISVADHAEIKIYTWGELLRALNKSWS